MFFWFRIRRLLAPVLLALTVLMPAAQRMTLKWATHWWENRTHIVVLAGINTGLTVVSELAVRQGFSLMPGQAAGNIGFLQAGHTGVAAINRQSLFNICMTVFASLFGGPVLFMRSRWARATFFIGFGGLVSVLGQCAGNYLIDGLVYVTWARLCFDMLYNASVKLFMFEIVRPWILRLRHSVLGMGACRVGQDFSTTAIRVGALHFFGIH